MSEKIVEIYFPMKKCTRTRVVIYKDPLSWKFYTQKRGRDQFGIPRWKKVNPTTSMVRELIILLHERILLEYDLNIDKSLEKYL